ncbi:phosphatase PAP2 family protein [candidate division KSB1 bacterium]|nr:phosphatase PAP2 family protein [candidate division KSB1 bacterium]
MIIKRIDPFHFQISQITCRLTRTAEKTIKPKGVMPKIYKLSLHLIFLFLLLITSTFFIARFDMDMGLARVFFKNNSWYLGNAQPWKFLYEYGTYPMILFAAFYLLMAVASYSIKRFVPYRKEAVFFLLVLLIGPGLLINSAFKDHWGRPRPREVKELDGKWEFREVWQPGVSGKGNSFPCGHCSMGFALISFYFAYRRKNKLIKYAAIPMTLLYGGLMSLTRIIQGGHFLSDAVWSGGIVYFTVVLVYYILYEFKLPVQKYLENATQTGITCRQRVTTIVYIILACTLLGFLIVILKPHYKEFQHSVNEDGSFEILNLSIDNQLGDIEIVIDEFDAPCRIYSSVNGLGYLRKKMMSQLVKTPASDTLHMAYTLQVEGYFFEIDGKTIISLDDDYRVLIEARTGEGDIILHSTEQDSVILSSKFDAPKGTIYR